MTVEHNQWIFSSVLIQTTQEATFVGIDIAFDFVNVRRLIIDINDCWYSSTSGSIVGRQRSYLLASVAFIYNLKAERKIEGSLTASVTINNCHWSNTSLLSSSRSGETLEHQLSSMTFLDFVRALLCV
jgi:hypothetical protein